MGSIPIISTKKDRQAQRACLSFLAKQNWANRSHSFFRRKNDRICAEMKQQSFATLRRKFGFRFPSSPPTKTEHLSTDKCSVLFIQAAGLAYHRHTKCGVYHQGRLTALVSHHAIACIFLRLDDIQHFVLMICNSLRN